MPDHLLSRDSTSTHRMPFLIFQNNLDMFARIMKSSCDLSLSLVEASKHHGEAFRKALPDDHETVEEAVKEAKVDDPRKTVMNSAAKRAIYSYSEDVNVDVSHLKKGSVTSPSQEVNKPA
ncbi:MAG: hypothetical protein AAF603_08465 [Pseudomonadota bacterium]